jgi:hypothetical protein
MISRARCFGIGRSIASSAAIDDGACDNPVAQPLEKQMGWMFPYQRPSDPAQYLRDHCLKWTPKPDGSVPQVVDHAKVGTIHYFAVRFPASFTVSDYFEHDLDGSYTVCLVFLTQSHPGPDGWGYKDMDECCGPSEATCPVRILDKLSPIKPDADTYAREWREKCREYARTKSAQAASRKKLCDGMKVTFTEPLTFTDGSKASEFQVAHITRRGKRILAFRASDSGRLYRIDSAALMRAQVSL